MRGLLPAACLLAPVLAKPAAVEANDDAIPSAFISLHLPPHDIAQARDLTFRFDIRESQSACGIASVTINDQALHQSASGTGQGSFTSDQGNIIVANWNFTCVEWNGTPQEQFLSLGVDYVDGLAFENVGFVLRFQQTAPVWISDIEGSASMTRVHRADGTEREPFSDEREPDLESELVELEFLKFQLYELEQIIFMKEQRLVDAFGYRGEKGKGRGFDDCDNLKCFFRTAYYHVHDAAASFYSDIWGKPGHGMHHHKGPHHPPPPHCPPPPPHHGNHTHPNGTFPHPPPWAPPPGDHKPPFHPPPFCRCPPPPRPPHHGGPPPHRPHEPPHGGPPPHRPHEPPHGPPYGTPNPEVPERPRHPPHGKSSPEDKGPGHNDLQSFDEKHDHGLENRPHGPPHDGDRPPPPPPPPPGGDDEHPILPPDGDVPPPGHRHDGPEDGDRPPKHGHHGRPAGPGGRPPPPRGFIGDALKIGASLIVLALLLFTVHFRASKRATVRRVNRHARHARRQSKRKAFFQRLCFWRRNVAATIAGEQQPMMQQRNVSDDDDESDAMSTTMEQEIQQFRVAASMVEDMVAAEEGRAREMEIQNSATLNLNNATNNNLSHSNGNGNMGFMTLPPLRGSSLPQSSGSMPVTEVHMAQLPPQPTLSQVLPLSIPQPGLGFGMGRVLAPRSPTSAFPEYIPADDSLPAYDYDDSSSSSMIADGMMYQPGGSAYSPGSSTGGRGSADEFGDAKPRREQGSE